MKVRALAAVTLLALGAGAALHLFGEPDAAEIAWGAAAAAVLPLLTLAVARALLRRDVGVDAIALVAIATAIVLGEELAAAIVALMMSGGAALEEWAAQRARVELRLLVERAPRRARRVADGQVEDVAVEQLVPGDLVLVSAGDVVPADGQVASAHAVVDASALTGEPLPVSLERGDPVQSGTTNAGEAFELRVTKPAAESAYAAIVRLVEAAERDRAPFVRLADRYAALFLPATLVTAAIAGAAAGDARRALAVLVVATPCPLILAAPVAFVAGLSRAARSGVILKGAGVVERLGKARTVLLDKTGTLTVGSPEVEQVVPLDELPSDEALRLAASLDQVSGHALAAGIIDAARRRGLELALPSDLVEEPGRGIAGTVSGRRVAVGSAEFLAGQRVPGAAVLASRYADGCSGRATVLVGVDGEPAAAILMGDHLRPGAEGVGTQLHAIGVDQVCLVSGDRREVAEAVGRRARVDRVYAGQTPEGKVDVVRMLRAQPHRRNVVMVGDGINDAPALAVADVGIAMGSAGATVSSETADAVVTLERADAVVEAVRIGRRSLSIARQSVVAGLALSLAAMGVAAAGYLPPVWGALLQEGIDVGVIVNALRALRA